MKKITHYVASALALVFFSSLVSAEWTLIEDWEDGNADGWFITRDQNPEATGSGHRFFTDPEDPSNTVHYLQTDGIGENFANYFAATNLPQPVGADDVATLYFRYYQTASFNAVHFGLTHVTVDPALTPEEQLQTHSFGSYEVLVKMHEDAGFQVRDGNTYKFINEFGDMENNVWYEFWVVMDNSDSTFKTYVKGGERFPEQTLLLVPELNEDDEPTGNTFDDALYRNATGEPLTTLLMAAFGGRPSDPVIPDPHYFDDIYMDFSGENLESAVETEEPTTWGGFEVSAAGDADTEDWLGWVNVSNAPWIWSYSLETHIFMDEPDPDSFGEWGWILK